MEFEGYKFYLQITLTVHGWRAWECADAAVKKTGRLSLFQLEKRHARLLDKKKSLAQQC